MKSRWYFSGGQGFCYCDGCGGRIYQWQDSETIPDGKGSEARSYHRECKPKVESTQWQNQESK